MPASIILNGNTTYETCSVCQESNIEVQHGQTESGNRAHYNTCPNCGSDITIVGYNCPDCPVFKEQESKWKVDLGIHSGTVTSRDSAMFEFDTEEEARSDFEERRAYHQRYGRFIWYANLISPEGKKIQLDPGEPYA